MISIIWSIDVAVSKLLKIFQPSELSADTYKAQTPVASFLSLRRKPCEVRLRGGGSTRRVGYKNVVVQIASVCQGTPLPAGRAKAAVRAGQHRGRELCVLQRFSALSARSLRSASDFSQPPPWVYINFSPFPLARAHLALDLPMLCQAVYCIVTDIERRSV